MRPSTEHCTQGWSGRVVDANPIFPCDPRASWLLADVDWRERALRAAAREPCQPMLVDPEPWYWALQQQAKGARCAG